jgi:hypothetical protein
MVTYDAFMNASKPPPEWFDVRKPLNDVPALPAAMTARTQTTRLPGWDKDRKKGSDRDTVHCRCKQCHSLLPPQFWRNDGSSSDFALAVIGYAEVGKTTWLTHMFTPPSDTRFEMIRDSENLVAFSYDYAEPYTIELLSLMRGARTSIPWTLLGTTVKRDRQRVVIRTLDIRGEHLLSADAEARAVITRHLTMKHRRSAALLVVDRFEPHTQTPTRLPISQVYHNLQGRLPDPAWSGVVWTYLDVAQWTQEAADWLGIHVPAHALRLIELAGLDPVLGQDLYPRWQPVLDGIDATVLMALVNAVSLTSGYRDFVTQDDSGKWYRFGRKPQTQQPAPAGPRVAPGAPTGPTLDGLIALLFRLQIAYSLKAGLFQGDKDVYFLKEGFPYCNGISDLARELYCLWSRPRGALADMVRRNAGFKVFPCGMVGGKDGVSVWSDAILLEAMGGAGVTS